MRYSFFFATAGIIIMSICLISCKTILFQNNKRLGTTGVVKDSFTIAVQPYSLPKPPPGLQSGAWAISGNHLLLIGGRMTGYHGLPQNDSAFKTKTANKSIGVIDMSDFSYTSLPLNPNDSTLVQFFANDFEFYQDNDTLFIAGGYGVQNINDAQSNHTFNRLVAIQVSEMIKQVLNNGNVKQAILGTISSPFLQVTGGALFRQNGIFYLMFGQNYEGIYQPELNGKYTNAIRQFRISNSQLSDTISYIDDTDTILHRRDLTVAPVIQNNDLFYAAFGGVFTYNNDGFTKPVYIRPNGNSVAIKQDTLTQITNHYNCALVTIFDAKNNICTNVLMGGIGKFQYDTIKGQWEDGDNNAKLPFVRSITQMGYYNGVMHQHIQIPPNEPQLPAFIGTNAVFIPNAAVANTQGIINYNTLVKGPNLIGYLYGGIESVKPTSSNIYPTTVNNKLYAVYLNKVQ